MRVILYCQSLNKVVQNVVLSGQTQATKQTSYAISVQNHTGDGVPLDPNVPNASFGATMIASERPDFDAGDLVAVEVTKYVPPQEAPTPKAE